MARIPMVALHKFVRYDAGDMILSGQSPSDTSEEAERAYIKLLAEAPLWRKAEMVNSLTKACRELAVAGIRLRHPNACENEIRMRLAALWIDRELMVRAFGWDPQTEGY